MDRRAFLKAGGLALFSATIGGTPLFLQRAAAAALNDQGYRRRKTLVTIFQRGAMDGIMAVTPFQDPALREVRPNLLACIGRRAGDSGLLPLDDRFALHPAFQPFLPYYQEGRLAIVHGIGSPNTTRSHFDAQDYMESGTPFRKGTDSGWLNRAVGLLGHEPTPFRAVSITPAMPRVLYGDQPVIAVTKLTDLAVDTPGAGNLAGTTAQSLEALYRQTTEELLGGSGRDGFDAIKAISDLEVENYVPARNANYPVTPLGRNLRQIAMLIKADVGLEVAFTESNGWDTHVAQGAGTGTFQRRASDLAQSIDAFWTDIEAYHDNVTLMTMTEFGRTIAQNGSGGTDHGRASCMFVLGNAVKGGSVYGDIPDQLTPDALEDGRDLPVTTDFRALFSDVAMRHLKIDGKQQLFPDWQGNSLKIMKNR